MNRLSTGTQEAITAIRQGGVRGRNGGGGGEEGREAFSPLSNMLPWGPVHRLQFPSLVSTIMKVEFKQDSRISIQCTICVI